MKIYFSGSIRGGREDKEIYNRIIEYLKKYGEVLTEHIGDVNLEESGEKGISDEEIFERDINLVKDSDVVIAEVTTPSLGVGYELRLVEEFGKKHLILFNNQKGKKLSGMISGNSKLNVRNYDELEEAFLHIDEFMKVL